MNAIYKIRRCKTPAKDGIGLNDGKNIPRIFYSCKNRKYQQRSLPQLSLFRLLLCFFQAQILLMFLSVPIVAAVDPASIGVVNKMVDRGDIMVSLLILVFNLV